MKPELYLRIRSYIKRSYNRYITGTKQQKALGFIMTVYRRRLTSSFKAIELSLERRFDTLVNKRLATDLFDEDDREAEPTLFGLDEDLSVAELEGEIDELARFIADLKALPGRDEDAMPAWAARVVVRLRRSRHRARVHAVQGHGESHRRSARPQYGARVMSYSGADGGRRLDPTSGEVVSVSNAKPRNSSGRGKKSRSWLAQTRCRRA